MCSRRSGGRCGILLRRATSFSSDNNRREEVEVTFVREKCWSIGTFQDIHVLSFVIVEKIPDAKSIGISTKAPLTFFPGGFRANVAENFDVNSETHK